MPSCSHLTNCYVQWSILPPPLVLCTTMIVLTWTKRHDLQPGEVSKMNQTGLPNNAVQK
jgi:hypothetical protein